MHDRSEILPIISPTQNPNYTSQAMKKTCNLHTFGVNARTNTRNLHAFRDGLLLKPRKNTYKNVSSEAPKDEDNVTLLLHTPLQPNVTSTRFCTFCMHFKMCLQQTRITQPADEIYARIDHVGDPWF